MLWPPRKSAMVPGLSHTALDENGTNGKAKNRVFTRIFLKEEEEEKEGARGERENERGGNETRDEGQKEVKRRREGRRLL